MKKNANPNIQVVIGADRMVYHNDVVNVIDMIRKINIARFAINVNLQDDFFRP
jgi:biopolymer transport protein ExbD